MMAHHRGGISAAGIAAHRVAAAAQLGVIARSISARASWRSAAAASRPHQSSLIIS